MALFVVAPGGCKPVWHGRRRRRRRGALNRPAFTPTACDTRVGGKNPNFTSPPPCPPTTKVPIGYLTVLARELRNFPIYWLVIPFDISYFQYIYIYIIRFVYSKRSAEGKNSFTTIFHSVATTESWLNPICVQTRN